MRFAHYVAHFSLSSSGGEDWGEEIHCNHISINHTGDPPGSRTEATHTGDEFKEARQWRKRICQIQCASSQFSPMPTSTTIGTSRGMAVFIFSSTSAQISFSSAT